MFRTDLYDIRPAADPAAVVQGERYRFTVLTSRLIRIEWSEDGKFEDRPTRIALCRDFPVPQFTLTETADSLEIETEHLHLYYDKQPFSAGGLSVLLKGMIKHKCDKWHYGMPQNCLFGKTTNLGGTCRTLDMVDGRCEPDDGLVDLHGFTVLRDAHESILGEDGWYRPTEHQSEDLYFFGYLLDHAALMQDFTRLSGATPMIPRWALGNWWCRYHKYTEESYEALIRNFAEHNVPMAVSVVDMDWHITQPDPKYGDGWTGYTWNRDFFPDPPRFLKWLHDHGLHTALNVHPASGVRAFEDCYENAARAMGIDPATEQPVKFDVSDPKFMRTYLNEVLHPLEDEGVDFWWVDWQQLGGAEKAGYDALWMLNHYLYTDNARKGTYPLLLSRYGGLGSHRYPAGFSGDTKMTWESLDFQPEFTNKAANVAYGWWSHDIGGHKYGEWSDDMQVRWCQYGVFSPIYRPHSGWEEFFLKEPWNFPVGIENVIEDFMRLRHAMIPYLYTMNYRTHTTGLALCLPMYYVYPRLTLTQTSLSQYESAEGTVYDKNVDNQYFFGTELMVCPITSPLDPGTQTASVQGLIPQGDWFDFFTGRHYRGKKMLRLYRPLEQYPVLAKAGAIVPLADDGCVNGAPLPGKLRVRVFAGADGAFDLYEDDGMLRGTRSAVTPLRFTWDKTATFTVLPVEGDKTLVPQGRTVALELTGCEKPAAVKAGGKAVDWTYDEKTHTLAVAACGAEGLTVTVETTGALAENDWRAECLAALSRWQMKNTMKQVIFETVQKARSRTDLLGQLPTACSGAALGMLAEILASAE